MTGSFTLVLLAALAGGNSDVTLVEFTEPGCQPCRAMEPVVRRLAAEKYPVQQVDASRRPDVARQFGIVAYPTFVLVSGGREVQRFAGITTYDDLVQMISRGQQPKAVDPRSLAAAPATPLVRGQSPEVKQVALTSEAAPPDGQLNPEQRALAASVRLKVEDAGGWGVGTGTIIDTHFDEQSQQYEALVLTCGHLFKSSQGKGKIAVEVFATVARTPVPGELLDYDEHRDVALISIWPGVKLTPAPVAAPSDVVRPQDQVFTVGCSSGQDPTVERSKIHAVNRYANRPNLTVGGRPAQGRSGGGLFNAAGQLIGVCNADDPQDGEGIYAGPAAVHGQLDKFNLQQVYQRSAVATADVGVSRVEGAESIVAAATTDVQPTSAPAEPTPSAPASATTPLASSSSPATAQATELVCIFRSRTDPQGQSEVLVIDAASAELIQKILDEAKAAGQARLTARQQATTTGSGYVFAQSPKGVVSRSSENDSRPLASAVDQVGLARRQRPTNEPVVRGQSVP